MTPINRSRYTFSPQSIVEVRKQLGLTQSKMADLIGVETNTLSRWETGAYPPDAEALAFIYSLAMQHGITPNFFRGKGLGRNRLLVMWDFQNLGLAEHDVDKADTWLKQELNKRFPSISSRRFKAFAHTNQVVASEELMRLGWRVWEDDEDVDEDMIQQILSDCGQSPLETVLVILTKDGDFAETVRELIEKGVRVYLVAPEGSSQDLVDEIPNKRWIIWNGPPLDAVHRRTTLKPLPQLDILGQR